MGRANHGALLGVSQRELALYEELLASYRALAGALGDETSPVDPAWVTARHAETERAVAALRDLAAELGPERLGGEPVPPEIASVWRASAELAAEAARLNAEIRARAVARQAAVAAQRTRLGAGRRALAGYRPPEARRAAAGRRA